MADLSKLRKLISETADAARGSIRAYHGSPYDFDRFDASKIGTGEGAQAYGYGMYFAGAEPTAKSYRDSLSGQLAADGQILDRNAPHRDVATLLAMGEDESVLRKFAQMEHDRLSDRLAKLQERFNSLGGWESDATKGMPAQMAELRVRRDRHAERLAGLDHYAGKTVGHNRGHMYEVAIDAPEQTLLDWDAPISRQPKRIQKVFGDFAMDQPGDGGRIYRDIATRHGEAFDDDMTGVSANLEASKELLAEGVPGLRYLDGGSRAAGQGTRNYVMFPGTEDSIRILRKYGLLPPLMAPVLMQDDQ
jgi:hypothetical protein